MNINQKVTNAIKVFKQAGLKGLINASKKYFIKLPYSPDEPMLIFEVLNASKTRGIMIDVGAHIGTSIASFVESNWTIYAFEPDSTNREKLSNVYGHLPNVTIDSRAVSNDIAMDIPFYKSNVSSGISSLSSFHSSHEESEKVCTITLEKFYQEHNLNEQVIDFLKVDTEGFDFNVIKSIPWTRNSPRVILCEFEDNKTIPLGYTFHDMAQYLVDKGYKLIISEWYPIQKYGTDHKWNRFITYPCKLSSKNVWGNILAIKEEYLYSNLLNICKLN